MPRVPVSAGIWQGCPKPSVSQHRHCCIAQTPELRARISPAAVDTTSRAQHHCHNSRDGRATEGGQALVESFEQQARDSRPPPPPPPPPRISEKVRSRLQQDGRQGSGGMLLLTQSSGTRGSANALAGRAVVHLESHPGWHSSLDRLVVLCTRCCTAAASCATHQQDLPGADAGCERSPASRHTDRSVRCAVCHNQCRQQGMASPSVLAPSLKVHDALLRQTSTSAPNAHQHLCEHACCITP